MDPTLQKDYQYFVSIRDELIREHLGKFALIRNGSLIGVFDTEARHTISIGSTPEAALSRPWPLRAKP
jgi:hypothetical protein